MNTQYVWHIIRTAYLFMKLSLPPRLVSILTLGLIAFMGGLLLFKLLPADAPWAKAILFGVNTAVLGILAWRMTPSLTAGLVIAVLFVTSKEMLLAHVSLLNNALFIFLSLLSFWTFDLYFERPPSTVGKGVAGEWWWLVATGLFVGMAYLIHYAGLSLVITFTAALLVLRTTWRKRFTSIGLFLAGTLPLAFPWPLRNRLVNANITPDRVFVWHSTAFENFHIGIVETMIVITWIVIFLWALRQTWIYTTRSPRFPHGHRSDREAREVISYTTGVNIVFAVIYAVFFDPAPFEPGSFSPMIAGFFLLLVAFGIWMRNKKSVLVIIFTILILAFSLYRQAVTVAKWSDNGINHQSQHETIKRL